MRCFERAEGTLVAVNVVFVGSTGGAGCHSIGSEGTMSAGASE